MFNMHFKLILILFESKVQDLITPKIMDMSPPEPATSVHLDIESGRPRGVFFFVQRALGGRWSRFFSGSIYAMNVFGCVEHGVYPKIVLLN